jgi:hypothetical protein
MDIKTVKTLDCPAGKDCIQAIAVIVHVSRQTMPGGKLLLVKPAPWH